MTTQEYKLAVALQLTNKNVDDLLGLLAAAAQKNAELESRLNDLSPKEDVKPAPSPQQ